MRVSIVNPKKKGKKGKKRRTAKQTAASKRNIKKAQKAKAAKKSGRKASTRKSSKRAKKGSKKRKKRKNPAKKKTKKKASKPRKKAKRKAPAKKKKSGKKGKKKRTAKQTAASKRNIKKAQKSRKGKKSKKARKPRGKKVRPVMHKGKTKKGKKVLRHSPKSRYARAGYRFNPIGKLSPGARKHMVTTKGAELNWPHLVGGAGGFVASGMGGGMGRVLAQTYIDNTLVVGGVSLVGNYLGTEVPAMVVHWGLEKTKVAPATRDGVCRGMRIGGYIAMGLNAATIVLKALNVGLPFRALSGMSDAKDLWLSGVGDVDLALAGLGDLIRGNDFVATEDYAGLDDEGGLLDAEIAALSAYMDESYDEFGAVVADDSGLSV